jgi:glycosyltransferase involved in cell wall biosynthesis
MRILIATPYYSPAYFFGGPVRMAETMAEGFLAAGHEVTVATTDALDDRRRVPADAGDHPPGARVIRFPNVSHVVAARAMGWTPRGYRAWMARHAGEHDVIHLHDVYSVVSVAAARSAVAAGVPYVVQPFGSLAPTRERGRAPAKRAFLALWGRRTLREAAALVYSTEDERADFVAQGAPEAPLTRMPLPLSLPPATGTPEDPQPTVAYVGRLNPIKRIETLIEAVAMARREVQELRLEIAGPGEPAYRASLEALAGRLGVDDAVTFHGFVSPQEKVSLLERAHLFCLLSRSEGLPVAALEAMACGTPVVLSRACHLPEVHEHAGLVVDAEPSVVAAAMTRLLRDDDVRARFGHAAAGFAAGFEPERVLRSMIEMFERLAPRADPGRGVAVGR